MPQFFCSLPNEKKAGRIPVLVSDNAETIAAFIKRWHIEGRGVYCCINPLRNGATRRAIETVGAIERLAIDIDFKDLTVAPADIEQRLRGLPLPPTWVRRSGGGLHVGFELKEPVAADDAEYFRQTCELHKKLVATLSGDPAVAHPAALLRVEGTSNTKRGAPVVVETLWGSGKPVDLSEVETLIELLPTEGMFERKADGNGHDQHSPFVSKSERTTPIEVDTRLRDMKFKGAGESAIHTTQLQVTAALLRTGCLLDDVVADVLEATRKAVRGDRRTAKWDWEQEEFDIRRMCCDFVSKAPELSAVLPEPLRAKFEAAVAEGKIAKIVYARHIGWHVRSFDNREMPGTGEPAQEQAKGDSPTGTAAKARGWNYYDSTETTSPRWLVKGLLPETGVGILAGQWGSFKTTAALDLSVSVMTGTAFAGQYRVKRKGAVLYFAVEGAGTLKSRLEAIARHRGAPDKLPFAWRGECPLLTAKGAGQAIVKHVDEAAVHFEHAYGMPITLIWVDTYVTAAGLSSSGDDNDAAAAAKAFNALRFVAANTSAFVAVVDHYGKILEAGTRGSSAKEGTADTVLATLAERELTGAVSNTRMTARKQRDGISGFELPFTAEKVEQGLDEDGDPITAIVLDWGKQQQQQAKTGRKPKTLQLLCQVLAEVTADKGFRFQPEPGGPTTQAVYRKDLLAAFNERYHAEGNAAKKRKKRWAAYSRAMKAAVAAALVAVREIATGEEIIWARK
jgi:AAA domain